MRTPREVAHAHTSMCIAADGHKVACDALTTIIERDRADVHDALAEDLARALDVLREVASVDGRSRISPSAVNNARALLAELDAAAVDIVTGGGR